MRTRTSLHGSAWARFLRLAWCRRLESALTVSAIVLHTVFDLVFGVVIGTALLVVVAGAFVWHGPTRRWMLHRYRAQRLEYAAGKAFEAAGFAITEAPAVIGQRALPSGVAYSLGLHPRCVTDDLVQESERLAVAFGARAVTVTRSRERAGRAEMVVSYDDRLAGRPIPWPWTGLERAQLWTGLPFGYDEDDHLVVLELAGRHLLLGGEPGAGKSNALSLVVAGAAIDPMAELWLFDGKLVELQAWRRCARRFVGPDLELATSVLGELKGELDARFELLADRDLRQIGPEHGFGLVVVVIDELAFYLRGKSKAKEEFAELLHDVVARGRAAGVVVVAATQKPSHDIFPTSTRDLMGNRLALRCTTREASDTILGGGMAQKGYSAADIDAATRGVGYLLTEASTPRRMRCFVLDDEHLKRVAARAQALRGVAP